MIQTRHCAAYCANDNNWYLELADGEYEDRADAYTYGPFASRSEMEDELGQHANPGSIDIDPTGSRPAPTESPNGDMIYQASADRYKESRRPSMRY